MLRQRFYYALKPFVPWSVRMALRRILARRKRAASRSVWPIDEAAGRTPAGWPGWPDGKKFAVVLTHDVEGPAGLAKCRQLAEVEMELGFRSSFNFIPEGPYTVPVELREWLTNHGFEIGIHDLEHDGRLFRSRSDFILKAGRINGYVRDWGASGFRAGFMLRNLEWIHELDIEYDMSTFDTDPFEFEPDGAGTIFPFWISAPPETVGAPKPSLSASNGGTAASRGGYVELPYTLAQDSTVFLVFREASAEIWKKKLDWIADRGGMALVNVHPDYLRFAEAEKSARTFPIERYREFLKNIALRYDSQYLQALPRDIARIVSARRESAVATCTTPNANDRPELSSPQGPLIWIDLDNTPHVPFFKPIIRELKARGYRIHVTARDAFQVCELATKMEVEFEKIGRHYGKNLVLKLAGLLVRGIQLLPTVLRTRPMVALSHGSRSQIFISKLFRIPTIQIMDYEFSSATPLSRPLWEIVPDALPDSGLHTTSDSRIRKYRGIKEDVYVPDFRPDPGIIERLSLRNAALVVTVRPPANEAHYHNPESEILFDCFMNRAVKSSGIRIVLLPRNKRQEEHLRSKSPHWFTGNTVIIPAAAEDGMNLLWHSDLAVSGGGTMNREAAALGVPVYSIFRGRIGAVDKRLQDERRLTLIENVGQVESKIHLVPRKRAAAPDSNPRPALNDIIGHVENIVGIYFRR